MRVLESKVAVLQVTMGKRKHKLRKQKKENDGFGSESSDEGATTGRGCPHLTKAVNLNSVRKALKQISLIGECLDCQGASSGQRGSELSGSSSSSQGAVGGTECAAAAAATQEELLLEGLEHTVWLCLQCAHQGCDRNTEAKHAMKHYQTPRSASHALVVNVNTWQIWCYDCDDEVQGDSNGKLLECVDFVRKQTGLAPKAEATASSQVKKSGSQRSGAEAVTADTPTQQPAVETKGGTSNELKRPRSGGSAQVCQSLTQALPKVRGLSNLGNTCFFNAVMQNLSQTHVLESTLGEQVNKDASCKLPGRPAAVTENCREEEEEEEELSGSGSSSDEDADRKMALEPLSIMLGECGALTQSMLNFLRDMNSSSRNSTLSPNVLFGQVCRKAPRFKGFQQQDSHELLRHLLDGMKAEEIRRRQHGILKEFNLSENSNRKKVHDETRVKVKEYGRQAKHTFVDMVFGGHFISTVLCEDCKTPSQIFEPFLDISLPITEEKTVRPNSQWGARGKKDSVTSPEGASATPEGGSTNREKAADAPSKHGNKKARKQAKKEAKRKGKAGVKSEPGRSEQEELQAGSGPDAATAAAEGSETPGRAETGGEEKKGQSEEENMSDADIEDNIESDVSRTRVQMSGKSQEASENDSGLPSSSSVGSSSKRRSACSLEAQGSSSEDSTLKGSMGTTSSDISSSRTKVDTESSEGRSICSSETIESLCSCSRSMDDQKGSVSSLELVDSFRSMHLNNGEDSGITNCTNHTGDKSPHDSSSERTMQSSDSKYSCSRSTESLSRAQQRREASMRAMTSLAQRYQAVSHECSVMSCLNQFTAAELLTGNNKFGCSVCTRQKHLKQGKQGKRELVLSNASKQLLILSPPTVLTLHLKRFQQVGFSLRKVNRHVEFPMLLDLAPYCSALCQGIEKGQQHVWYSLYGVVEHSGRLSGGHYTAYVKVRPKNSRASDFLQTADFSSLSVDRLVDTLHRLSDATMDDTPAAATPSGAHEVTPPPGKWYYISDSRVNEVTHESNVLRCQAYLLFYERIY